MASSRLVERCRQMKVGDSNATHLLSHVTGHFAWAVLVILALAIWKIPWNLFLQFCTIWVGVALVSYFIKKSGEDSSLIARMYLRSLILMACTVTGMCVVIGSLQDEESLSRLEARISKGLQESTVARPHTSVCVGCPEIWRDTDRKLLVTSGIEQEKRHIASFRDIITKLLEQPSIFYGAWTLAGAYLLAALFTAFSCVIGILGAKPRSLANVAQTQDHE